jgi:hypothetical protein
VTDVTFTSIGEFTDPYGKKSNDVAVKLTYSRETASKIDWKGLEERSASDWKAPYRVATSYYINPAVWKNLTDKIPIEGGTGE